MTATNEFIQQLASSIRQAKPFPPFPAHLSQSEAYALQHQLLHELADFGSTGLKAGVTQAKAQEFFGLTGALLGQLYGNGALQSGCTLAHHPKALIECEIGIIVDSKGKPISAAPALEFVRIDFARAEDMTAANLTACNLGADRFLLGEPQAWRDSYDDVAVTLTRDGDLLLEASMMESLGGPHHALQWMLQEAQRQNVSIDDNMLLMTGTCGPAVPALPGNYSADYGEFGKVSFSIV